MDAEQTDEQIIAYITGTFYGKAKRPRAKPHRCIDCGKVTARVRCDDCWTARLTEGQAWR